MADKSRLENPPRGLAIQPLCYFNDSKALALQPDSDQPKNNNDERVSILLLHRVLAVVLTSLTLRPAWRWPQGVPVHVTYAGSMASLP